MNLKKKKRNRKRPQLVTSRFFHPLVLVFFKYIPTDSSMFPDYFSVRSQFLPSSLPIPTNFKSSFYSIAPIAHQCLPSILNLHLLQSSKSFLVLSLISFQVSLKYIQGFFLISNQLLPIVLYTYKVSHF